MMNRETGEVIGDTIGNAIEVDAEESGLAMGRYLRVKVMLDIHKPLMRGGKQLWCPLRYEFLPNFCYACGLLGHVEKAFENSS